MIDSGQYLHINYHISDGGQITNWVTRQKFFKKNLNSPWNFTLVDFQSLIIKELSVHGFI